jgi:hypothetical protein
MALQFALDEHLRGGALWQAIQQHNGLGAYLPDVVRVGDPPDLPLGTIDADILLWTEREDRLFLSLDKSCRVIWRRTWPPAAIRQVSLSSAPAALSGRSSIPWSSLRTPATRSITKIASSMFPSEFKR